MKRIVRASFVVVAPALSAHAQAQTPPREAREDTHVAGASSSALSTPSAPLQFGPYTLHQVNVNASGANVVGDAANECSLAVDPNDPGRMAIGWRQFDTLASNFRQAGRAWSSDGGRSWTNPGVLDPGVFRSDPVLASDANGNFYYNSLTITGSGTYTCDVYKSTDSGATWSAPVPAYGGDKAWMAIDTTASSGAGHVYTWWSVFGSCCGNGTTFNRSTDGALSFGAPLSIPNAPIWGTLDVQSDGTLFLGGVNPQNFGAFSVARSSNARNAAVTPTFDLSVAVALGGSIVFSAGMSSPNPGGLLGQVYLGVDRSSGATSGNVYLLASVDPPGADPLDVMIVRSVNDGQSWSAPVRVNDDPAGNGAWQWFGTLAVAPNGRLDVTWNDTRNTAIANWSQTFTSSSNDGGLTWSPNVAITPPWDSHVGWPNQQKIGDYVGLVADAVGSDFAFAATFHGEQDVYYVRLGDRDCNQNGVGDSLDISSGTSTDYDLDGIPDDCECAAASYCQTASNSSGSGATIDHLGSLSVAQNSFTLRASGCPPGKAGIFYYGPSQTNVPFGDGFRCVTGGSQRLGPVQLVGAGGVATRWLDFTVPPASSGSGAIAPLSTWNFQFWYRDSVPQGSGFNLSDGLSVTFCP